MAQGAPGATGSPKPSRRSAQKLRDDRGARAGDPAWPSCDARGASRRRRRGRLLALDIGTEYAKALVFETDDRGTATVRGVGRKRQGLSHMQSGTVADIPAVVANCREALHAAEAMAGPADARSSSASPASSSRASPPRAA